SNGATVHTPIIINGPESYTAQYTLGGLQLDYKTNFSSSTFDVHASRKPQPVSFYLDGNFLNSPPLISKQID
ncbi:MAG TPA: hypothetical protein VE862_02890, partial [Candidatus Acidoferrum sp.]|nr:hypothetical protein [Candidatus Acidoferrum sp.]